MDEQIYNYIIEEYKALRREVEHLASRSDNNHRYSLLSTGLYWSWISTSDKSSFNYMHYVSMVIFVIVIWFFYRRWKGFRAGFQRIAAYTQRIENAIHLPSDLGWEHYLDTTELGLGRIFKFTEKTYWHFLILANVAAVCFVIVFENYEKMYSLLTQLLD